ncbi:MAG: ATPase with chaperone activity [Rubrivivax sp.]|nr:ATPase with chaperone activity [Rubrivivax sp.]
MSDESQILVPPSFVVLYLAPGKTRPSAPRAEIAARHEFCEDLATMLTEHAATRRWELGITEADVLERVYHGLLGDEAPVSAAEARWVIRRLAELLDWDALTFDADPGPAAVRSGTVRCR